MRDKTFHIKLIVSELQAATVINGKCAVAFSSHVKVGVTSPGTRLHVSAHHSLVMYSLSIPEDTVE